MNRLTVGLIFILSFSAAVLAQDEPVTSQVKEMSLDQLPAEALAAARKAKPAVHFKSAEQVWWHDEPVYRVMGTQFRTDWSVYVNIQGAIVHISSDTRE